MFNSMERLLSPRPTLPLDATSSELTLLLVLFLFNFSSAPLFFSATFFFPFFFFIHYNYKPCTEYDVLHMFRHYICL